MSLYTLALFLQVSGAIGAFVSLSILSSKRPSGPGDGRMELGIEYEFQQAERRKSHAD